MQFMEIGNPNFNKTFGMIEGIFEHSVWITIAYVIVIQLVEK